MCDPNMWDIGGRRLDTNVLTPYKNAFLYVLICHNAVHEKYWEAKKHIKLTHGSIVRSPFLRVVTNVNEMVNIATKYN